MNIPPQLINLAIEELPDVIARVKARFQSNNPDEPVPTSEQVLAAFDSAYRDSLMVDEAWKASHPEDKPGT